ncbi:hypothetical protein GW17_00026515 [Ensete ventricosum]|nr:hypothetical protein GW17_00026515 [Ensete ventricosum]
MAERRWWFGWRRVQRQRFSLKQYEKGEEWRRFSRWQISLSYSKPYLEREKMRKCERRRRGNDFGVAKRERESDSESEEKIGVLVRGVDNDTKRWWVVACKGIIVPLVSGGGEGAVATKDEQAVEELELTSL